MASGLLSCHHGLVPRYRLTVAYLGAAFAGWQRQADQRTVQGTLESALHSVFGQATTVTGAGRTDAGVHAAAQVAHTDLGAHLPGRGLKAALNAALPPDVRIRTASRGADDFHALRDATGKLYVYRMRWRHSDLPWAGLREAQVRPPCDWDAVSEAARLFSGTLDMGSFTVPDHGRQSTVRTILRCSVTRRPGGARVAVEGEGFLRYQVRRMVGVLLEVGWGRRTVDDVGALLAQPAPGAPIQTAPARGLTLEKVYYRPKAMLSS